MNRIVPFAWVTSPASTASRTSSSAEIRPLRSSWRTDGRWSSAARTSVARTSPGCAAKRSRSTRDMLRGSGVGAPITRGRSPIAPVRARASDGMPPDSR